MVRISPLPVALLAVAVLLAGAIAGLHTTASAQDPGGAHADVRRAGAWRHVQARAQHEGRAGALETSPATRSCSRIRSPTRPARGQAGSGSDASPPAARATS